MTAAEIAAALGDARREGPTWRCRCPLHGGHSLILRDGDGGRLLVTCWGDCDRLDVLAELRRLGLLGGHAAYRPCPAAPRNDNPRNDLHRIACARRIWGIAGDPRGTPAARYLAGRAIELEVWPASLRYHPRCPRPHGEPMPAMVALVEHVERGVVGVHRTFLTIDYRRHDRASLGPIGGGAVRFGSPRTGEWLAVAEGIETALAVVVACAMPAWAALSAGGIRSLLLPPPATHVLICADHDASGTGERAARDAAARWLGEGRRVRIAMPPKPGTDMADVLADRAHGATEEACRVGA
jgi:hypothetical protein